MSEFATSQAGADFSGFDYLTAGTQPSEKGVQLAHRNTLRLYDKKGDPPNIGRGEIEVHDFSLQGYNHPEGDFTQNANGFAWSELVTLRPNEMVPGPTLNGAGVGNYSGNKVGLHGAYAFGIQFLALGSSNGVCLNTETSKTDPTLVAVAYSPSASICSLTRVVDDGVERLAIGRIGAAVQLLSDAVGTVATTMHTSTNSCWGIIMSGINATDAGVPVMLIYAGTTIGTKATNADLTTAIVATVPPTTVNAGGFAIGAIKAKSRGQRAYWAIPRITTTAGGLLYGAANETFMDIWSTDMTGTDLLPVDLQYLPDGIIQAASFRDGILATDGFHIVYWDGENEYDLGIFKKRVQAGTTTNVIDSDERKRVRNLIVNGPECGAVWQWFDQTATVAGKEYMEIYNFESGTWHNWDEPIALTVTTATFSGVLCAGALPISPDSRHIYHSTNIAGGVTGMYQSFLPRPGESLLWQHSQGSGGTSNVAIPVYDTTAKLLGCRWWLDSPPPGALPGINTIRRNPKIITEVEFNGNLDYAGSAAATLQIQVQGRGLDGTTTYTAYDQTFSQGQPSGHYKRKNTSQGRANIQDVQLYLVYTGPGTRKIPLLLPFIIRFAYSKDGTPITDPEAGTL